MSTDINLVGNALKKIGVLLILFVAAPILLTMAFKAIKLYKDGFEYWLSILFLVFAGFLVIFTVYFAFKAFGAVSKALFKNTK